MNGKTIVYELPEDPGTFHSGNVLKRGVSVVPKGKMWIVTRHSDGREDYVMQEEIVLEVF